MRPEDDLSPLAFALTIASAFVGPKLALYVSAYGIILAGWFAGLLFGLYTRAPESKLPVWAYALFTLIVCLMATVTVAQLAVSAVPWFKVEYTSALFPVAALIAGLPDYWGRAGAWVLKQWQDARGMKQ